jgi:hypothetical protein
MAKSFIGSRPIGAGGVVVVVVACEVVLVARAVVVTPGTVVVVAGAVVVVGASVVVGPFFVVGPVLVGGRFVRDEMVVVALWCCGCARGGR